MAWTYDKHGENNPAFRHGHSPRGKMSPEYRIWAGMKTRCTNPKQSHWHLNAKGYSKDNCRWATPKEQARNSRICKFVVVCGQRVTLTDAAKLIGVDRSLLTLRIQSGLTPQEAVDKPVGSRSAGVRAAWARKKGAA